MTTETINGLHSCKPENKPVVGETKTFVVEHKPARNGKKPWIKIRSAGPDYGGEPYRILSAEPTGFTDTHGNISFNIEIEPANDPTKRDYPSGSGPEGTPRAPQAPPPRQNDGNGVEETRRHLMQSANLMLLAIKATAYIGDQLPEKARTGEQMQSILAQLFIEASHRRTDNGVDWYSFIDRMPSHPLEK